MKRKIFVVMALLCVVLPGIAAAAIYKWVDANGVVTFRDTPPPDAETMKNLEVRPGDPSLARPDAAPAAANGVAAASPEEAATLAAATVELFVTSWCPYCKQAEEFLRARGVTYTAYDIEKDSIAAQRKEVLDGQKGVPFAIINGRMIHGFSEDVYKRALLMKAQP